MAHPPNHPQKIIAFAPFQDNAEGTVAQFLTAVRRRDHQAANRFLSNNFQAGELIDPKQLYPVLDGSPTIKRIPIPRQSISASPAKAPPPLTCTEVLLANNAILRVHLIRERDKHSHWKIYAIEKTR